MLADGQALDGLTVPIFHGGAISGRVFDASGDPVDYAQVGLLRMPAAGRVGRPTMRGGTSTDDRGEFRIGRLEPGNYLLQVTARRPNVDEPTPTAAPAPQPMPTYYPGVLSINQAQPIAIERGQSATDLDIVLAEGVPGVVVGTVTMSNGSPLPEMNGYVNARRAVADGARMFDSYMSGTGVRPDGTFRLVLPPGDYQLEARLSPRVMNAPPKPEDEQFGTAKVSVNSGSEDAVAMTVGRGATATGRVVFEGTSPPPPSPGPAVRCFPRPVNATPARPPLHLTGRLNSRASAAHARHRRLGCSAAGCSRQSSSMERPPLTRRLRFNLSSSSETCR